MIDDVTLDCTSQSTRPANSSPFIMAAKRRER
jgi:hypothetical protein